MEKNNKEKMLELIKALPVGDVLIKERQLRHNFVRALNDTKVAYRITKSKQTWRFSFSGFLPTDDVLTKALTKEKANGKTFRDVWLSYRKDNSHQKLLSVWNNV